MSLPKALGSSIRRIRSVILLALTISLLFYYTFQNEINMLNSFAENEYIPSNVSDLTADEQRDMTADEKDLITNVESSTSDLSNPDTLREKNRYFPLLLQDASNDPSLLLGASNKLDTSALFTYKEKYPVLNEVSLPLTFSYLANDYPRIQTSQYETGDLQRNDLLSKIRRVFSSTWAIDVLPSTISTSISHEWPILLVDSMDTLYIMRLFDEFEQAVKIISNVNFKIPPESIKVIDVPDYGSRLLGGLISAYDLSQNSILLTKAIDVADFLLRSFDTPNRIPILKYDWRSKTSNKFPYQNSHSAGLTSLSLEFLRLAQITRSGKYFDATEKIFRTIAMSSDEFALPHMLPQIVDASGCTLISKKDVLSGKHLRDSKGMKSIDQNLNFVHCHQTGKLLRTAADKKGHQEIFEMKAQDHSLYGNLLKSLHILNGNDLIAMKDAHVDDNRKDSATRNNGGRLEKTTENNLDKAAAIKQIVTRAMDQINEYMSFNPLTPLSENLTFVSSLKAIIHKAPASQQFSIEIIKSYDMHHERCSLAGTLGLASKIADSGSYIEIAKKLTSSCFELFRLFKGSYVEDLLLDPCEAQQCLFNVPEKLHRLSQNYYQVEGSGKIKSGDRKTITTEEDIEGGDIERTLWFSESQGPSFLNLKSDDVQEETQEWKQHPSMPLWVNKMGKTNILSSTLIESVFYLYRITGETKWRKIGETMFKNTLEKLQALNAGAKGVWKVEEMHEDLEGKSLSEWYSRTLKYYYLLFSSSDDYTLDDYVFTSGGHLLKREPKLKEVTN
ncbi:hypothetical protein HG535_0D05790 [Zygotorulaspora mrakii]|uniref:alpha-1,2-Mannosidase n=1 Tax=Zygotorulaspora mrakii TaxID=42260 RepID=A0A7H9B2M5_ZYGMR|nr:uncharacterized protein HG535_0D05790 [Zygotorulaspora mrakii]QLG72870.1 hypothetical protein HG535_0D05790 [Zygotorulaspora mrakii]